MKAYGLEKRDGLFGCKCCGGKFAKHEDSHGKQTSKAALRKACRVKSRQKAKKEVQQEVADLFPIIEKVVLI